MCICICEICIYVFEYMHLSEMLKSHIYSDDRERDMTHVAARRGRKRDMTHVSHYKRHDPCYCSSSDMRTEASNAIYICIYICI